VEHDSLALSHRFSIFIFIVPLSDLAIVKDLTSIFFDEE
jgi:hypothetical protein